MNSAPDRTQPLAPLARRRRTVLIGAIGFLVLLLSQVLQSGGTGGTAWQILAVAGIVTLVFGWAPLILPGRMGLPRPDQPDLDERQHTIITNAYAGAYHVLAAGLILAFSYGLLTSMFEGLPELTLSAGSSTMLIGLVWLYLGLPAAILAWNEPDPAD